MKKIYFSPITTFSWLSMAPMMTAIGSGATQEDARTPQRSIYI